MVHPLLKPDSYKFTHFDLYPDNTQEVTSYIESRGFTEPFRTAPDVVFLGLQYFIQKYLDVPITAEDVEDAYQMMTLHGIPFNYKGFKQIVHKHGGYFPVRIEALEEGTVAPTNTPLVQFTNTDPNMPWVASFIETAAVRAIWYPTTVGTLSREAKKHIKKYLELTAEDLSGLPFKLHDFGSRGVSSQESSEIGGAAHLVNFMGTDTTDALYFIRDVYNNGENFTAENMPGFSVIATEHSISTTWGPVDELGYASKVVTKLEQGTKIASIVADTYDVYNFCRNILGRHLKNRIVNSGGTLVVRPDSGDPIKVTLKIIEILGEEFGYTINSKGYKLLPPYIRIIQGDGVNLNSIEAILKNFADNGWSTDNIVLGMGGGLLQHVNRDTLRFAQKANEVVVDGERKPVFKDPVTDSGKRSKKGKQYVYFMHDKYVVIDEPIKGCVNLLKSRWSQQNGVVFKSIPISFDQVRENAVLK